jgi:uridylate kinase
VLIKISGEALSGGSGTGLDFGFIEKVCLAMKKCTGYGRTGWPRCGRRQFLARRQGRPEGRMERSKADHMGMLATVMNALAVSDRMEQLGMPVKVMTSCT